jgi:hypothetical protein
MMTIRSRRDDDNILKQLQNRAVEETLNDLPYITEVFRNKEYNLSNTITNEVDFLLGAVFSQRHILFTVLTEISSRHWNNLKNLMSICSQGRQSLKM